MRFPLNVTVVSTSGIANARWSGSWLPGEKLALVNSMLSPRPGRLGLNDTRYRGSGTFRNEAGSAPNRVHMADVAYTAIVMGSGQDGGVPQFGSAHTAVPERTASGFSVAHDGRRFAL